MAGLNALVVALLLAGCASPGPTPQIIYVTPAPTPQIIYVTPAPTATASPSPAPTASPSPAPTASPSPSPSPKPTMSLATLKSRFNTATLALADQVEAHDTLWADTATAGDYASAGQYMLSVKNDLTTYANKVKALPWPASMRADAKALEVAAIEASVDASLLSGATSRFDPLNTVYSPALIAAFNEILVAQTVLLGDLNRGY